MFAGLDVGKSLHHLCALTADGTRVFDCRVNNDETELRAVLTQLQQRGPVLLVVDQPAGIGALPLAVARHLGVDVAYLPGLAMRRIAEVHPGQAKTDARDAHVIADAARTLPHTLRRASVSDAALAELTVLLGYDDDLTNETTRLTNRARDLLMNISPALERALGPRITHPAVRAPITAFPTPQLLRAADPDHVAALLRANAPRIHTTIHTEVTRALAAQTVLIPGTTAAGRVLASIIRQINATLTERTQLLTE